MKWVLIWFVMTAYGVTSGSTNFESESFCESTALGIKVEVVTHSSFASARCYPLE